MGDYGDAFALAVSDELRAERARVKKTIDQIVTDTGYAKTTVLNYLNGKRDIPLSALREICRSLGVDPRVIVSRADERVQEG